MNAISWFRLRNRQVCTAPTTLDLTTPQAAIDAATWPASDPLPAAEQKPNRAAQRSKLAHPRSPADEQTGIHATGHRRAMGDGGDDLDAGHVGDVTGIQRPARLHHEHDPGQSGAWAGDEAAKAEVVRAPQHGPHHSIGRGSEGVNVEQ